MSVTCDIFEEKSRDLVLLELKKSSGQSLIEFLIRLKNFRKIGVTVIVFILSFELGCPVPDQFFVVVQNYFISPIQN